MKTLILAIVASVMLAATAHAGELACDGELTKDSHGNLFVDACEIDRTQVAKVLATCRLNRRCQVQAGTNGICRDPCLVTRVLSVKRPRNDWFIPGGTNQE